MFCANPVEIDSTVILQCEGRLIRSEAAYHLRNTVYAHRDCANIIVDLSRIEAVGGGGLGMLAFLLRWSSQNGIQMKIIHPTIQDRNSDRVKRASNHNADESAVAHNIFNLIGLPERKHWVASSQVA